MLKYCSVCFIILLNVFDLNVMDFPVRMRRHNQIDGLFNVTGKWQLDNFVAAFYAKQYRALHGFYVVMYICEAGLCVHWQVVLVNCLTWHQHMLQFVLFV